MTANLRVAVTLEQCWHRVPGGTAASALGTVRALSKRAKVDIIGVSAHHHRPPVEHWQPPVVVRSLPLPRVVLYEAWHRLRRPAVERATGPVDVIHATGVAVPPRSAPIVLTVHDLAFLHEPKHFTRRGIRFFGRALDVALRDADLVLCPSNATLADCRHAGFDPERLRVVPWGVGDHRAGDSDVKRVRRAHGLKNRYLLWTGTIEPRKNLPGLLRAFRRLGRDDLDLVLVGPRGWGEDLTALLEGIGDRVRVLGFVSGRDLEPLYAGAEVFCYPSLREGFGLPVLEAMAQATPVVTSRGTATEEIAGGAGLVVDPRDPESIADAIREVLDDPQRAAALGEAGRARASEYTWARTAELTEAAYTEAAS